jgi:hypothetical protein
MSCYRNTTLSRRHRKQIQYGRGVGSILRTMYNHVFPVIKSVGTRVLSSPITKSVLKIAKQSAADAGIRIVKETLQGKKLSKSLGSNLNIAKEEITDAIKTNLGIKKGRKRPLVAKRQDTKRTRTNRFIDIYNDEKVKID